MEADSRPGRAWGHRLGRAAEELAAEYLRERGCRVLARRFRARGGEVDLIVRDRGWIAFVEVKARHRDSLGGAAEAVDSRKQRRLGQAAAAWIRSRGSQRASGFRFDVIEVTVGGGHARTAWIRDAFRL